jgi:lipopolysaccharide/colanic/teichoic acid biosynthesis glycosyltransferase
MARNYVRATEENEAAALPRPRLHPLLSWVGVVLLALAAWETLLLAPPAAALALSLGLHLLLALGIERGLQGFGVDHVRRYRFSFLLSGGIGLAYVVLGLLITAPALVSPVWAAAFSVLPFAGALAGGILATTLRFGIHEDNSPPSPQVLHNVHALHQPWMADLEPTPWAKRGFDLLLAVVGLVLSAPVWMLSVFLIWFEDPGPILFIKNSVGKGGKNFRQYKFRTMIREAEQNTGPVLASQNDARVLKFGRLLRKTALDELPQLLNILAGEMSFVGPRPQRTVLVCGYLERMPEYALRHRVLPGLAGLAQVAGDYYLTPRQKLRYDRLYIRYSGLAFDLKLVALAFLLTFWYRWQKDWNGRLPRALLKFPRRASSLF